MTWDCRIRNDNGGLDMTYKVILFTMLMVFVSAAICAAPADIPKSGQTARYDANSVKADDGGLQKGVAWPRTRFTSNADTTGSDNLTNLVWAPNGNIMPTRDNGWDVDTKVGEKMNDGRVTWLHALDYVSKLNAESYLGHTDWRLPNVNELESIVHAEYPLCNGGGCYNAAWLNTQGFSNVQQGSDSIYWSSTISAGNTLNAWYVNIEYGFVNATGMTGNYYVWPVRGPVL